MFVDIDGKRPGARVVFPFICTYLKPTARADWAGVFCSSNVSDISYASQVAWQKGCSAIA
jgi:hypothetical protein